MKIHIVVTNAGDNMLVERMKPIIKDLMNIVNFSCEGMFSSNGIISNGDGVFDCKVVGFEEFVTGNKILNYTNDDNESSDTNQKIDIESDDNKDQEINDVKSDNTIRNDKSEELTNIIKSPNAISSSLISIHTSVESMSNKFVNKLFRPKMSNFNVKMEESIKCDSILDQLPIHTTQNYTFSTDLLIPVIKKAYIHIFWMEFKNNKLYLDHIKPRIIAWNSYLSIHGIDNWIIAVIIPKKYTEKTSIFNMSKNKTNFGIVMDDFDDDNDQKYKKVIYIYDTKLESIEKNYSNYEKLTESIVLQCVESFHRIIVDEVNNLNNDWNKCRNIINTIVSSEVKNTNISSSSSSFHKISRERNNNKSSHWRIHNLFCEIATLNSIYSHSELYQNLLDLNIKNCSRLKKYLTKFIFDRKKYKSSNSLNFFDGDELIKPAYIDQIKNERFSLANFSAYGCTVDGFDELLSPYSTNRCSETVSWAKKSKSHRLNMNSHDRDDINSDNDVDVGTDDCINSDNVHNDGVPYNCYTSCSRHLFYNQKNKKINSKCLKILGVNAKSMSFHSIVEINDNTLNELHRIVHNCYNKRIAINNLLESSFSNHTNKCIIKSLLSLNTIVLQLFLNIGCIDFAIYFSCDIIYTCDHIIEYIFHKNKDDILVDRIQGVFMLECLIRLLQRVTNVIDKFSDATYRGKLFIDNWQDILPTKKSLNYAVAYLLQCIDWYVDKIHVKIASYAYQPATCQQITPVKIIIDDSESMNDDHNSDNVSVSSNNSTPNYDITSECGNQNFNNKSNNLAVMEPNSNKHGIYKTKSENLLYEKAKSRISVISSNMLKNFMPIKIKKNRLNCSSIAIPTRFSDIHRPSPTIEISIVKAKSILKSQYFDKKSGTSLSGDLAFSFINQAHKIYQNLNYQRHIHTSECHILIRFIEQNNYAIALNLSSLLAESFFKRKWFIFYINILLYRIQIYFRLLDEDIFTNRNISSFDTDNRNDVNSTHTCSEFYIGQCHIQFRNKFIISSYIELLWRIGSFSMELLSCATISVDRICATLLRLILFGGKFFSSLEFNDLYSCFVKLLTRRIDGNLCTHSVFMAYNHNSNLLSFISMKNRIDCIYDIERPLSISTTSRNEMDKLIFYSVEAVNLNLEICMYYSQSIDCDKISALFIKNTDSIFPLYSDDCNSRNEDCKICNNSARLLDSSSVPSSFIQSALENQRDQPPHKCNSCIVLRNKSFPVPLKLHENTNHISMVCDLDISNIDSDMCGTYTLKEIGFYLGNYYIYTHFDNDISTDSHLLDSSLHIISDTITSLQCEDSLLYMIPQFQRTKLFLSPLLPQSIEDITTIKLVSIDRTLCLDQDDIDCSINDSKHTLIANLSSLKRDNNNNRYILSFKLCPTYSGGSSDSKIIFFTSEEENSHYFGLSCDVIMDNRSTISSRIEFSFTHIITAVMGIFPVDNEKAFIHIVCFNIGKFVDIFINQYRLEVITPVDPNIATGITCKPLCNNNVTNVLCNDDTRGVNNSHRTIPNSDCVMYLQKNTSYALLWELTFSNYMTIKTCEDISLILHYNISIDEPEKHESFNFCHKFSNIKIWDS